MRILAALAALILLTTFAPADQPTPVAPPHGARVLFEPVPLGPDGERRVGRLIFLGGWALTSDDPRLGGLSGLHVEGRRVIAVSDAGWLFRFALPGRSAPLSVRTIAANPDAPGRKHDRDAESLAVAGGKAWVGMERTNAVWRYDLAGWRREAEARPVAMRGWRGNSGAEALVRLPGGRFLVMAEGGEDAPTSAALLFAGDPAEPDTPATRLIYRPPAGYRITDAALLPDGRLLFLNRRFRVSEGVSAKLTIGALPSRAGATFSGEEVADVRAPLTVDNFEALAVTRERRRTIVWIASDDNYSPPLQRTLLMKFAFDP